MSYGDEIRAALFVATAFEVDILLKQHGLDGVGAAILIYMQAESAGKESEVEIDQSYVDEQADFSGEEFWNAAAALEISGYIVLIDRDSPTYMLTRKGCFAGRSSAAILKEAYAFL